MIPMNFMKSKAGFTLVELIVVIAILGILAGIAVPAYSGYIKKANGAADTQFLSAVYTAAASACAAKGEVTEISVAATGGDVSGITAKYNDGTSEQTITLHSKTTPANNDADFMMFIGTAIDDTASKLELVKDGTYASGAKWTASGWAKAS